MGLRENSLVECALLCVRWTLSVCVNSDGKHEKLCAPTLCANETDGRLAGESDAGEGNERADAMANATDPLARSVRGMNPQVRDEWMRRRHTKDWFWLARRRDAVFCADFERRKEDDDDGARGDYDDDD